MIEGESLDDDVAAYELPILISTMIVKLTRVSLLDSVQPDGEANANERKAEPDSLMFPPAHDPAEPHLLQCIELFVLPIEVGLVVAFSHALTSFSQDFLVTTHTAW